MRAVELTVAGNIVFSRKNAQVNLRQTRQQNQDRHQNQESRFLVDWHLIALPVVQQSEDDPIHIFRSWLARAVILSPIPRMVTGESKGETLEPKSAGLNVDFVDLSDGEKCFFLCAAVLATNRHYGPLFCFWDEPDSHLSVSEVGHFVAALRQAFTGESQILVSSHNPEAIRKFSNESTFVLNRRSHLEPTTVRLLQDLDVKGDLVEALIRGDVGNELQYIHTTSSRFGRRRCQPSDLERVYESSRSQYAGNSNSTAEWRMDESCRRIQRQSSIGHGKVHGETNSSGCRFRQRT